MAAASTGKLSSLLIRYVAAYLIGVTLAATIVSSWGGSAPLLILYTATAGTPLLLVAMGIGLLFRQSVRRYVPPIEGLSVFVRATSRWAVFRSGAWELGAARGSSLLIDGQQVVGPRAAAITPPIGGATVDAEARAAIGNILSALREHGLIEM